MDKRFQHRASSYGISGEFHWPVKEAIKVRPSCDLPPIGGFARITEKDFDFHGLVSFKSASTEVSGSPNLEPRDGEMVPAHNNLSLAVIEHFNLLEVITVDRIVSRITTRYFEGSDELEIVLVGTRFEGFRVAGHEVIVKLATDIFLEHPSYQAFGKASKTDGPTRDRLHRLNGLKEIEFRDNEDIAVTIVERIIVPDPTPEFRVYDNVIDIPHVGKLFLGELVIAPRTKNLSMIRWELGCPAGGSGNIGGGEGGGSISS